MTASDAAASNAAVAAQAATIRQRPENRSTSGSSSSSWGLMTERPSTTPAWYGLPASASLQAIAASATITSAGWARLRP